jgi:hypothetical protein
MEDPLLNKDQLEGSGLEKELRPSTPGQSGGYSATTQRKLGDTTSHMGAAAKGIKEEIWPLVEESLATTRRESISEAKQAATEVAKQIAGEIAKTEAQQIAGEIAKTEAQHEAREEIQKHGIRIVEMLGLLVGLFTFVSVEFQVFRNFCLPWHVTGLTMILLGSLMIFSLLIDVLLNDLFPAYVIDSQHKIFGDMARKRTGQTPDFFNYKTWGSGLKFRTILFVLSILLVVGGGFIFAIHGAGSQAQCSATNTQTVINVPTGSLRR